MQKKKIEVKKRHKLKKSVIFKGISFFVFLISIHFFIMFLRLNILPWTYLFLLAIVLLGLNALNYRFLSKKKYQPRMIGTILSCVLICLFTIGIHFQNITLTFLHTLSFLNIQTENYNVITLKSRTYKSLTDLNDRTIAFVKNHEGLEKAKDLIDQKIKYQNKECEDIHSLIENLLDEKVDAIILEQEEKKLYMEMENEFKENLFVLDTLSIETRKEDIKKDVQMTKEPFNVYITGIDTYGSISNVSRSDVNIVATINPNTHKILLTSIPRDYYVQLHNTTGLKDKLTHAGLHGVDLSIQTIEDLLEEEINYYVKINFTSLVQIVDAIGGIEVESPFAFTANYQEEDGEFIYYEFKKGLNKLNGKQALAYSRERYALREGDIGRARHQQQVIKATVNKCLTPAIITKYASLIGAVEGNFVTNMKLSDITSFIQKQISEMPSWSIENMVLTGTDSQELTYTFPKGYGYVMLPDEKVVQEAREKINQITE